jgi:hypothetical protein
MRRGQSNAVIKPVIKPASGRHQVESTGIRLLSSRDTRLSSLLRNRRFHGKSMVAHPEGSLSRLRAILMQVVSTKDLTDYKLDSYLLSRFAVGGRQENRSFAGPD